MKSIAQPIIAVLAFSGSVALAAESGKPEPSSESSEVRIGPVSVSVAVTGSEGGKPSRTAYLGVVTGPVSPQLRAQLDLADGMGLSVEAVAQDSPAAKAGIRQYDVLKKFNDQMLCAQEQLSLLVKAAGKDATVALVLLRGGREQILNVTLGEHDAPGGGKAQVFINGVPGVSIEVRDLDRILKGGFPGGSLPDMLQRAFEPDRPQAGSAGIHENWEEMRKKNQERRNEIEVQIDVAREKMREAAKKAAESAEKAEAVAGSAKAQVFSFYPKGESKSVVTVADSDGTIEINDIDGKRSVQIKDAGGTEIYSGALDTGVDHEAVPEKFRSKVKEAEKKLRKPEVRPGKNEGV